MNKEEYREEVLRQLKEQNTHLNNIEVMLIFIAFLIGVVLGAVLWQNCSIGNIEEYVSNIKINHSDLLRQILCNVKWINDKLSVIEAYIQFR